MGFSQLEDKGDALFEGVKRSIGLRLRDTRRFKNGNVLLTYEAG